MKFNGENSTWDTSIRPVVSINLNDTGMKLEKAENGESYKLIGSD